MIAPSITKLRKSNNELDHKLTSTNKKILTDMIVYLRVSRIPDRQVEHIRQDLLHMILDAQERGEDISSVIGMDYKVFCDEIIANAASKTLMDKVRESIAIIFSCIAVLLFIQLIFSGFLVSWVRSGFSLTEVSFNIPISLGFVLSVIVFLSAAWIIVIFIGKHAFRLTEMEDDNKSQSKAAYYRKRILIGTTIGLALAIFFFVQFKLNEITLFSVHAFVLLGVAAVMHLAGKWLG